MDRTDKQQFECCLDRRRPNQDPRAPQDHSGGIKIDPKLQKPRTDPFWTDGLHFSRRINPGLSFCCRRRSHYRRKRKQARTTNVLLCSNQSINRPCVSSVDCAFEEGKPRMLPYLLKWKKSVRCDLFVRPELAQGKGLILLQNRQTGSCTARRHLNLKLSRVHPHSRSKNASNEMMWRENIHRIPWAQHEETRH